MAVLYVNNVSGSDSFGTGSSSSPYATINHCLLSASPGTTIIIQDGGAIHEEPETIVIDSKLDIKIQSDPLKSVVLRVTQIHHGASIYINASDKITISGITFLHSPPPPPPNTPSTQAHAIKVNNSTNILITGNRISEDWECHDVPSTELFYCDNSDVTLIGNFCTYIENSYPSVVNTTNFFSFISVSGNGRYIIRNNAISNVHSNSGYSYGIKVYPNTREIFVDDFSAKNFIPAHVDYKDKMIGIYLESDTSPVAGEIKNIQLDELGYGIQANNFTLENNFVVKKALITNCLFAGIYLTNQSALYNIRHLTIVNCGNALQLSQNSVMYCYNSIFFKNHTAFRSETSSLLKIHYSVHFQNTIVDSQAVNGLIDRSHFVRFIDPKFVNEDNFDYRLTDYSPCVDTGKYFDGDLYLGNGPDLGFYEKSALTTEEELPSLLSKTARQGEIVPLTEIDILGMVTKGVETSDGRILASREGSAIRDVAIKPLDLILRPYLTDLEIIRERLSFDKLENLSEEDADLLAANVFVKRNKGAVASGVLRIYFSEPTDAIIYAEHEFKTNTGLKFYCRNTTAITAQEMSLNYDKGTYYMDIIIDAEIPSADYNLPPNSVTISTMPMPPGTLSFTNPYPIENGVNSETNAQLKEKAQYSITVRDIVTKKGARAILPELSSIITDLRVIGYRDAEMERDYIQMINDHIGGKADFYIKTRSLVEESKIIYPDSSEFIINDGTFSGYVPILKITKIEILEPISEAETGIFLVPNSQYTVESVNSWYRFSPKEELKLVFSQSVVDNYMPNTPFKIYFKWIPEMKTIQSIVESDKERVVVADLLVRAMEPTFISFTMAYKAPQEIPELSAALTGFIEGLKSGSELQQSDLIAIAYQAGVQKVLQPMEIQAEHHKRNGEVIYMTSPDGITIPRISTYWADNIQTEYFGPEESDFLNQN